MEAMRYGHASASAQPMVGGTFRESEVEGERSSRCVDHWEVLIEVLAHREAGYHVRDSGYYRTPQDSATGQDTRFIALERCDGDVREKGSDGLKSLRCVHQLGDVETDLLIVTPELQAKLEMVLRMGDAVPEQDGLVRAPPVRDLINRGVLLRSPRDRYSQGVGASKEYLTAPEETLICCRGLDGLSARVVEQHHHVCE